MTADPFEDERWRWLDQDPGEFPPLGTGVTITNLPDIDQYQPGPDTTVPPGVGPGGTCRTP